MHQDEDVVRTVVKFRCEDGGGMHGFFRRDVEPSPGQPGRDVPPEQAGHHDEQPGDHHDGLRCLIVARATWRSTRSVGGGVGFACRGNLLTVCSILRVSEEVKAIGPGADTRWPGLMHTGETVRSRREEYAEATYEALLDSASACFFENGFVATSLDHVAHRARVTKGAIYHHFTSKRDLFMAVLERQQEHSVGSVTQAGETASDAWSGIVAAIDAFLETISDPIYRRLCWVEGPSALGFEEWWACGERYEIEVIHRLLRSGGRGRGARGRRSGHAGPRSLRRSDRGRPGNGPLRRAGDRAPAFPRRDAGRHGRAGAAGGGALGELL